VTEAGYALGERKGNIPIYKRHSADDKFHLAADQRHEIARL
jgi:hypothetical protein